MSVVGVSFVSLLNAAAHHCRLPFVSYLWEVDGDGVLLAGVELALPVEESICNTVSKFFWVAAAEPLTVSHEMVAQQAVRFLQAKYGFAVQDYNFGLLLSYRKIAAAAVDAAVTASAFLARSQERYGALDLPCQGVIRQCKSLWVRFVMEEHFFCSVHRP